ncbi:MAG: S-methyl-5-thioribose-1-phosphate isomerase [Candidatus Limnocylindrales bacterium]
MSSDKEHEEKEAAADLDRRAFFRAFSRDALNTAATVVGAATAVRRGTTAAASELLGISLSPEASADRLATALGLAGGGYRSPYRVGDGVVHVLDQRRLPAEAVDIECRTGGDVVATMRSLAARGGPLLGQLAAYAMALAAERNVASKPFVRNATLRGTGSALIAARPDVGALTAAVERCLAAWQSVGEMGDGADIAVAVRAVADAIASEATLGLGRLCQTGAVLLAQPEGRPLEIVTIDETGPLSGGLVGTALGVVQAVAAEGRPVHVWILETRPARTGARLAAPELRASDVPCTVIADAAIGWLLSERTVDVALVGAERVAANGDVANAAGTYPLAVLAERHGVPLHVCAPLSAVDAGIADGSGLAIAWRPAADVLVVAGEPSPPADTDALVPLDDVTPAGLVADYVTDQGVLRPPFAAALIGSAG